MVFGEMIGGKGYSFRQDKNWMGGLEEDLREFGAKSEGGHKTAQKAGRWLRWVEDRAEFYMRKWHDPETSNAEK